MGTKQTRRTSRAVCPEQHGRFNAKSSRRERKLLGKPLSVSVEEKRDDRNKKHERVRVESKSVFESVTRITRTTWRPLLRSVDPFLFSCGEVWPRTMGKGQVGLDGSNPHITHFPPKCTIWEYLLNPWTIVRFSFLVVCQAYRKA